MKYKIINKSIINSKDIPGSIRSDKTFYNYLLDNSVAYYYSTNLSNKRSILDEKITKAGKELNAKFLKTLNLLNKISQDTHIKFLLFKTFKYIPEIIDGDIDIFIQEKDFYKFLKALEKEGFKCIENEHLKAVCEKEGFSVIEPRVNASFYHLVIFKEKKIWENVEIISINRSKVLKVTEEIDLAYLLLTILYGPRYLKLYLYLVYKKSDIKKLFELNLKKNIKNDLQFVINNLIAKKSEDTRFPRFVDDLNYIIWWFGRILFNSNIPLFLRFKHIMFFFYLKYRYLLFNKLVFKHDWPI